MAAVCAEARCVESAVGREMELDERCRVWGCARASASCVRCKVVRRVRTIELVSVRPISREPS
jgi:hypothetical protein